LLIFRTRIVSRSASAKDGAILLLLLMQKWRVRGGSAYERSELAT